PLHAPRALFPYTTLFRSQRLVARHLAVAPAEDAGGRAARGRQRLEAEPGEDARRPGIPRVGDHEDARRLVERAEPGGPVALGCRDRKSTRLNSSHEWISY